MTSEAVNDELHASDPLILIFPKYKVREGGKEPHPLLHAHKYTHSLGKTNPSKFK